MTQRSNLMIAREILSPAISGTKTLTVPRVQLKSVAGVTAWVFPTGQDVTVNWRMTGEKASPKLPNERTGAINEAAVTGVTATAAKWTPVSLAAGEILPLGDLLIDVVAGGTAPDDVHVLVMGSYL